MRYCKDCKKKISRGSKSGLCASCVQRGKRGHNYKDGRWIINHYCKDCGIKIYYRAKRCRKCYWKQKPRPTNLTFKGGKLSKEARLKISKARTGKGNGMYGKPTPHGKWIKYKTTWMRSSWETRYAKWLDENDIEWEYEPKRFNLGEYTYCPDFYLPKTNRYIEIKGYWKPKAIEKFGLFKKIYPKIRIKVLLEKDLKKKNII